MNRFLFFMKLLIPYIYSSDIVIYSKILDILAYQVHCAINTTNDGQMEFFLCFNDAIWFRANVKRYNFFTTY